MKGANYTILPGCPNDALVIRDVGPWDQHLTVTNDIERVLQALKFNGHLTGGRKLYYYDSEGELTESVHEDGQFVGFGFPEPEALRRSDDGDSMEAEDAANAIHDPEHGINTGL